MALLSVFGWFLIFFVINGFCFINPHGNCMEDKFLISSKAAFFPPWYIPVAYQRPPFKDHHALIAVSFYSGGIHYFCEIIDDTSILLVFVLIYRRQPIHSCWCMPLARLCWLPESPLLCKQPHGLLEITKGKQGTILDWILISK